MPELPEVETIRSSLEAAVSGWQISEVIFYRRDVTLGSELCRNLPLTIEGFRRRGKYLLVDLRDRYEQALLLIVHFRMTGKWLLNTVDAPWQPHTHVRFVLLDRASDQVRHLDYVDVRRFGRLYWFLGSDENQHPTIARLGPEPLSDAFSVAYFRTRLKKQQQASIKGVLLNQEAIAGLGNIYVDEALFLAGIRPTRRAGSLSKAEATRLHDAILHVLRLGIGHQGTSFRDYVDALGQKGSFQQLINVYGRSNEACHACGTPIATTRVAGRTTRYCPVCQR